MKKQFGRSSSGDKPFRKKSDGGSGKPDFTKKKFSDKKSGGDKPFKKSFGKDSERPSYKKSFGEDKPFKKSFGGDRERGDKPFSDRKPAGDKPFRKSAGSDRDKPYSDRKPAGDKPFRKSFDGDRDKPFSDRKPAGDKPFRKNSDGDRDKPYSDRKPAGDRPFRKSAGGDRDKPFSDRKPAGDRPPFKKSFGGDRERGGDKPFKKSFGDKPDFAKKSSSGKPDFSKRSSSDKPYRKRTEESGFTGRKFAERKGKGGDDSDKATESENWQVFENADEAKEFIKSNRDDKKSGKSSQSEKEYKNDNRPLRVAGGDENAVRLNRFIANTGICSRREADDLIEAGVVKVNGKIVTELGTKVGPGDTVHYGDQLLRREKMAYVLLNKPKDYITTTDDPQERKTVMSLIETAGDVRIYPVGRLDRNTTGLLLFTNDGDLAERLTHPKNGVRKIYHVSLDKNLRNDDFEKILKGYEMEDGFMKADELSFVGDGMDKKEVGIVIHSGRNRIVRRLFESLGYDVIRLDRVLYAGLTKKNLPRGKFRHLTTEEVGILRMQIGGEKKTNFKKTDAKHTKGKRTKK
ncbi:MAG: pseudouridine synthase [Bacteroidota bacterium]|nr:pseudouridine synthase [Bacteroidota bacterium]